MDELTKRVYAHNESCDREAPSYRKTRKFVDDIIEYLFPIKSETISNYAQIKATAIKLEAQLQELLIPIRKRLKESEDEICDRFFAELPQVYDHLLKESANFTKLDPASYSEEEVILCYPGFYAIAVYRLAHILCKLKVPMLPRIMTEYAHDRTGIDIHPAARIGEHFFIDHGTGVVIGETAIIGNNVKIYQGVTLGAHSVQKELARQKRHPTIEDNVIIYSGSTILGGDTVVGHNTVIGGNVWLTHSVLPNSVVYHQSKTIVRDSKDFNEPINFVI
jgi:serine O-acetyltransferase